MPSTSSPGDLFRRPPRRENRDRRRRRRRQSAVDQSLLTGESVPVEVGAGRKITGATVNVGGRLVVRAERVGADTALAQIASPSRGAERQGAGAAAGRPRLGGLRSSRDRDRRRDARLLARQRRQRDDAFSAAVAVLIVACPCALGLATPTALLVGTGRGAQLGILIKGPEVLEATRRVDTIVLDKTGTVTEGGWRSSTSSPAAASSAPRRCASPAPSSTRPSIRSRARSPRRARARRAAAGRVVHEPRGPRRRGHGRRPRARRRAPSLLAERGLELGPGSTPPSRPHSGAAGPRSPRPGTARRARSSSSPTR